MEGHKFADDEEVTCMANCWLEDQDQKLFYNGMRALQKHCTKYSSVAGDYVEKWQSMMYISFD